MGTLFSAGGGPDPSATALLITASAGELMSHGLTASKAFRQAPHLIYAGYGGRTTQLPRSFDGATSYAPARVPSARSAPMKAMLYGVCDRRKETAKSIIVPRSVPVIGPSP